MWIELVKNLEPESEFNGPATLYEITEAEKELRVLFPMHLKSVLMESNGISGSYGLDLVWSVERILKDNIEFRTIPDFKKLFMPFDNLLFFAGGGNGDLFAYSIKANGLIESDDIFCWNHEDDSRTCVAPSLERYLEGWLTGNIKI